MKKLKQLGSWVAKKLSLQTVNCHPEFISGSKSNKTLNQVQGDNTLCHAEFVGQVCPTYKAKQKTAKCHAELVWLLFPKSIDFVKNVRFSAASNGNKTLNQVQGDTIVNNHSTIQPFNRSTAKQFAFTLAEVLITITIIGVVAAMTIPNLISDVNQRKYNAASGNFQRKLGEALRVMSAQNTLKGHKTTKAFVNELGKNIKIVKVCDTITECFPAEFSKASDTIVDTSTLTDAASLGQAYGTETVGVEFVNGVRAIVAYNPKYTLQSNGDVVSFDRDNKTVSMRTNVLSIIFDVSEDDNNKIGEDIFIKNTNFGSSSGPCDGVKIGDYCVKDFGTDYTAIPCTEGVNQKYCGESSGFTADYWAGANKKCMDYGMKMPTLKELQNIYGYITTDEYKGLGPTSGYYWTSTPYNSWTTVVKYLNFADGSSPNSLYKDSQQNILCVGN